jgi:hypothetical protein
MSRQVYLLGVGLALVAGAFVVTDRLSYPPGVTEANAGRVREWMSLREVEALLGAPGRFRGRTGEGDVYRWDAADRERVFVAFDRHGRVVVASYFNFRTGGGRQPHPPRTLRPR